MIKKKNIFHRFHSKFPPPAVEAPAKASNEYIAESIKEDLKALDYYSKNYDAKAVSITEIPGQLSQVIIVRNDSDSVNEVVGGEWKTVVLGPDNSFYTATEKASEAIEEIVFPPPLELKKNASAQQEAKQPTYRLKDLEPQRLAPVNPQQAVPVSTFSFKIGIDSGVKQPRAVLDARRAVVRRMAKVFIDSLPEPVARVVLVRTVEEIAKKQGVVADESYFFNNFEDYHHEAYIAFLKTLPGYNKWIIGLKKFLEQDAGPTLLWPPSWFGKNPESERLDAIFSSQNGFDFGAQGAFSKRIEKLFDAVMEQDTAEQLARKQEAEACRQAENQHKEAEARRIANEKQIAEQQAATSRLAEEQEVKEPYQKRSLPRRRNQEVSRAAGNETVLGDEEKGLIDAPCFPGYDNDENSKRSSDPLRDNVTVLPGSSCVVGGAENIFEAKDPFPFKPSNTSCGWSRQPQLRDNVTVLPGSSCVVGGAESIFEAKDPFPFKPSNTSCGWSRQPQLPELGKDENEEGQPALPTSPQGAADKDIKQGTVEQPDQQQGEQDMTGDKEELSRVEEESQEASPVAVDKTVQQEEAEKKQKEGAEGKKQEEPRLSAAEFEKKISKMSPGERVAAVKEMAERVAQGRGLVRDKLSKNISKKNPNRDIYRKADSKGRTEELYSTDTQHGRFEVCNKNGKHLREVDFDFKQTKGPDLSGKHDLIVK